MTSISKLKIEDQLKTILHNLFEIDPEFINDDMFNQPLLGSMFKFQARNLLYLLIEIEKRFNISIPEEDIVNGKFNTLNSIADVILCQIEKSDIIKNEGAW